MEISEAFAQIIIVSEEINTHSIKANSPLKPEDINHHLSAIRAGATYIRCLARETQRKIEEETDELEQKFFQSKPASEREPAAK